MRLYVDLIRVSKGMTQRELAERSEVARSYIKKMEANDANPTIGTLCKLANALEVDTCKLFSCD